MTAAAAAPTPLPSWIQAPSPLEFRSRERIWELSRHADIQQAARHPGVAAVDAHGGVRLLGARTGREFAYLATQLQAFLPNANPPFHIKGRHFIRLALRRVDGRLTAEAIGAAAAALLVSLPRGTTFDAMPLLSDRLPAIVIAHAFGVAETVVHEVGRLTSTVFYGIRRQMPLRVLEGLEEHARHAAEAMRREVSGNPILEDIYAAGRDEHGLGEDQMNALLAFLFVASTETTSSFLGNSLRLLAERPDALRLLREEPATLRPALDELVRFGSPLKSFSLRVATEPLKIDGCEIPAGGLLLLAIERAHFDDAAYTDPGRLDLRRLRAPNFGFGASPRACLGMTLAREEVAAVLGRLASYDVALAEPNPVWVNVGLLRRQARLPLVLAERA